jgi:hypothetical protein
MAWRADVDLDPEDPDNRIPEPGDQMIEVRDGVPRMWTHAPHEVENDDGEFQRSVHGPGHDDRCL